MWPENTLPAFDYAIAVGVDALELDVLATKDNVVVVSHDPVLNPPLCNGPQPNAIIRKLTLAQVKQWDCGAIQNPKFPKQQTIPGTRMPTLEEVFDLAAKGSFLFNVEIKSFPEHPELTPAPDEFARMVLQTIRSHHLEQRVILQSFDFRVLQATKRIAPEIKLSALYEGEEKDFVAIAKQASADSISPEFRLVTEQQVQAAYKAGVQVLAWTANTPEDWDRLVKAGVDGIITDDPAPLIERLKTMQ